MITVGRFYVGIGMMLWVLTHGLAMASPEGGVVVAGEGSIATDGDKTTVTQNSSDLVVDWDSFNVGQQERVHFEQQQTSDSVLNRIYDSRPSEIWGKITARGNVWLLNPNGVFFSRTSRVSTGGLVAAGLWMEQQDFMSGRYVLNNSRGVGDVSNAGTLEATSSGIGLAGGNVNNSGTIRASTSTVSLASGEQVAVDFAGDGLLRFAVESSLADASIDHSGSIEAAEVELSTAVAGEVFSGVINTSGVITARSVDGSGGNVVLQAGDIEHSGEIDADGTTGGEVLLEAQKNLLVSGSISARGKKGDGGLSTEQTGGSIRLLAERVTLESTATVDASGDAGGGEVLAGGGWQGNDPTIRNAEETTVKEGAIIKANANIEGDGGVVVVWSDGTTRYAGYIEARGGAQGGDGGEAEVSGKENLQVQGFADLTAANGKAGHLLLDPGTVTICAAAPVTCVNDSMNTFTDEYIVMQLGMGSLTIDTSAATPGTPGTESIINVESGTISWSTNILTLDAEDNINLNGGTLTASGTAALALEFGNMLSISGTTLSGAITATGDGTSTLVGPDANTSWTIDGASVTVGAVPIITLNMVSNLQGGSMADRFMVTDASIYDIDGGAGADVFTLMAALTGSLSGGDGDDTFNFNGGTVTGTVAGDAGSDTLESAGAAWTVAGNMVTVDGTTYTLSSVNNLDATGDIANTFTVSGSTVYRIDGGMGTDTVTGPDAVATWTVIGTGSGSVAYESGGSVTQTFSNIENLVGGSMADTFNRGNMGRLTGSIDGGAGADIFDFSGGTVTSTVTGGTGTDTLRLAGAVWTVAGNMVTVDGTTYTLSSVNNLDATGDIANTFTVSGSTVYRIDGGMGTDTVTGPDAVATWTVIGTGSGSVAYESGGSVTQTFSNIENLVGGSMADTFNLGNMGGLTGSIDGGGGTDTLTGRAEDATWTVTGGGSGTAVYGTVTQMFSAIENLVGGSMRDEFTVSGAHTGDISGARGADEFTIEAALDGSLGGGDDDDTFNLNMGSRVMMGVMGGGGNDTFNFNMGSSVMGGVSGGAGADTFDFNGGTVTGTVAGGVGTDVLDFDGITMALMITLDGTPDGDGFDGMVAGGATVTFDGVNTITGGSNASDSLQGLNADATWTLGSDDTYAVGTQTLSFSDLENMVGGSMRDEFTVNDAHRGNLSGGRGNDRFTITAALTGSLDGEGGDDTFNLDGGTVTGNMVTGGSGTDTLQSAGADWNINGNMVGTGMATYTLNGVENLVATGNAATTFMVSGGTDYDIDGGGGTDSLQSLGAPAWTIAGDEITVGGATYTLTSVENLVAIGNVDNTFTVSGGINYNIDGGGGGGDVLQSAGADWIIAGNMITVGGATYTVMDIRPRVLTLRATGNVNNTFMLSGGTTYNIDGGMGTDIARGPDAATTWRVTGGTVVSIGGTTFGLVGIETLQGGGMVDTFTVTGTSTYNIEGRSGADIFTIGPAAALTGTLSGGDGADTFDFNGGTVTGTVTGGAGADVLNLSDINMTLMISLSGTPDADGFGGMVTGGAMVTFDGVNTIIGRAGTDDSLQGLDVAATWTLGATDNYLANTQTLSFSAFDNLVGGGMRDTFNVNRDYTGDLSGGDGADTFTLSAMVNGTLDGGGGADTFILSGGGATSMVGAAGTDILRGPDADITWGVSGGTVTIGGNNVAITLIETLQGGSGVDTFMVTGNSEYNIEGRGGDDIFTIAATLTGSLSGGDNDDTFNFAGGTVTDTVAGNLGMDIVSGPDAATTWVVNGGMVSIGGTMLTLATIETLRGGSMVDTFTVSGTTAYSIDGGTGTITDILQSAGATWTVAGNMVTIDGTLYTLTSVENLVATGNIANTFTVSGGTAYSINGGDGTDIVRGLDVATTWGVNGDTVSIGGPDFTLDAIETLQGGSMVDMFMVTGTSTYNIEGGGGNDVFTIMAALSGSLSGGDGDDSFNLDGGTVTGMVTGGADTDTLRSAGTAWTIAGNMVTIDGTDYTLSSVESLVATGNTANSFTVSGGTAYSIDGGMGTDTFSGPNADATWTVTGTGSGTVAYDSGGSVTQRFMAIENLEGGSADDSFTLQAMGILTGSIAGGDGGGTDTLTGRNEDATWTVTGSGSGSVEYGSVTQMFSAMENLEGGDMMDSFTVSGSHTGDLSGGAGTDTFNLATGGSVSGMVAGGAGADILSYAARTTTTVRVEIADGADATGFSGTATDTGGFSGISNIMAATAMNMNDTFVGSGDGTLSGTTFTANMQNLNLENFEVFITPTVIGTDDATTWTLTGNTVRQELDDGTFVATFMDVTSLRAGTAVDTFIIMGDTTSTVAITLNGGGGADVFNLNAALYGRINGNAGGDTVRFNSGGSVMAVTGEADSGIVNGGAGADMFIFAAGAGTAAGGIVGGTDGDTLDFSAISDAITVALSGMPDGNGFDGMVTGGATVTFDDINTITGGGGTDSLRGLNSAATWTLGAGDSYEANSETLLFSALENMVGGAAVDTFDVGVHSGDLSGGGDADIFNIAGTLDGSLSGGVGSDMFDFNGGTVTGTVAGGAGDDTIDFGGFDSDVTDVANVDAALIITLSGMPNNDGFGGMVTGGAEVTFNGVNNIIGGRDLVNPGDDMNDPNNFDSLHGLDMIATWTLERDINMFSATGSYMAGGQTLSFSALENMVGGGMSDTFNINGRHAGMASGGAGDDSFVLEVGLTVLSRGIDGGSGTDTLTGMDSNATWTVDGTNSGMVQYVDTQSFSTIENLVGGSGADRFNLEDGGSLTGDITAAGGADVFEFSGGTVTGMVSGGAGGDDIRFNISEAIAIVLGAAPDADGFSGMTTATGAGVVNFSGIDSIRSSSRVRGDSLRGLDMAASWFFSRANDYQVLGADGMTTRSLIFAGIENLVGGGGVDTFNIMTDQSDMVRAELSGNGGNDIFNLDAVFYGRIMAGAGDDTFNFNAGGAVLPAIVVGSDATNGTIAGGLGEDVLNFGTLTTGVMVTLSGSPNIGAGTAASAIGFAGYVTGGVTLGDSGTMTAGFSGINRIAGSADATTSDTFSGIDEASTFTLAEAPGPGGVDVPADTYSVDAVMVDGNPYALRLDSIDSYIGGSASDSYVISREYIGNLQGGAGVNSFTINSPVMGNIIGGDGSDTIVIANVITGNVDAGDGDDEVRFMSGGRIVGSLTMGEPADTSTTDTDVLDFSMFDRPLTIIYDTNGGQAYVPDGDGDGMPDAVIMSDGQNDGMPGSGTRNGVYGAERIVGAEHNSGAGTGTYLVVQPAGADPAVPAPYVADLVINITDRHIADGTFADVGASLMLPDLTSFSGYVIIGGSGAPPVPINDVASNYLPLAVPGVNPNPVTPQELLDSTVIQARRLIIAGDVEVQGPLILLGSSVELFEAVISSGTEFAIVATGSSEDDFENNGFVVSEMQREIRIVSEGGVIIVRNTYANADDTVIDLSSGPLQFSQGGSDLVLFNPSSQFVGATLQPEIDSYIRDRLGLTGLTALILSVSNPASDLAQTGTLFIDTGLFEQDLTLFSLIGKGISLYLSMCEEVEGCAPPVELAEIDTLLETVRARLAELQLQLRDSSGRVNAEIAELVRRFEKVVRDMVKLRQEYVEIFGESMFTRDNNKIYEVSIPYYNYIAQAGIKSDSEL